LEKMRGKVTWQREWKGEKEKRFDVLMMMMLLVLMLLSVNVERWFAVKKREEKEKVWAGNEKRDR